ncbi:MAG TPA: response regulator [Candidatus Sulfotelmatobacter sp.]|nr:response regulator [Candidatus Sulfotelmatobacter sp.]
MARKILLADDSVTAQNMGRKILADAGYEVVTVNNGSAALKKIAETKPDLIVLDVYMPGYSGLEVCQRLKEVQETSRLPVLLTVGKLEPFKPEEARRVRAEGYIVKPFEASELLAALSKLEDKIVPRAESSKPGRFARANAALDEGRYDKMVAMEEDTSWKNRIAFPSKKKKSAEDEDGDDPEIYNAVNKDLRTTVDHKPVAGSHETQVHETQLNEAHSVPAEESRVDLGALVPEGLPKDVTPEEIAALAAAAAQVKGKILESTIAEPVAQNAAVPEEAKAFAAQPDAKEEQHPTSELPKESLEATATFADRKPQVPSEVVAESVSDIPRVPAGFPAPSSVDVMAAIDAMTPAGKAADANSGNGSASHHAQEQPADEPVTMAVAAGAEYMSAASRWTAVAVSLTPDEAAISLEHEMQKAHAAFAAAEIAHAESVAKPDLPPVSAALAPELVGPVDATPAPEASKTESALPSMSSLASAATEVISAAVREFEKVVSSHTSHVEPQPPVPTEPEPAPVQAVEPVAATTVEAKVEEPKVVDASISEPEPAKPETAMLGTSKQDAPELAHEEHGETPKQELEQEPKSEAKYERRDEHDHQNEEAKPEEPAPVVAVAGASADVAQESSAASLPQIEAEAEVSASASVQDTSAGETSAVPASSNSHHPAHSAEPAAAGKTKESEIAETTAAAWASWRRIRESGDSKHGQPAKSGHHTHEEETAPRDEAAMAVAAGAEKAPEEAPEDSGDIANIVDSVLADMRPKIVAEISKKLGKKK